ncbi:hypothetical protein [Polaribacter porphyrae]|uniref:Uncharacterized protein n=1 Tax=Polaribacter porphyrae TaxID=1137780 RepID=A0A2S7WRZ9_9FLAO|nr:hypothetical protein [Polaribacter porphyrae]PQJ80369.1 hypothetical protein BTO18_14820 [Polaribacter porphyrae]
MLENMITFYRNSGFSVTEISATSFLAKKTGSNFIFLKYTDYYFVTLEENLSIEKINKCHKKSKENANKDFKLPKALRFSVPNINSVFITENNISKEVISCVRKRNIDIVGGQQESIFILDKSNYQLHSAGKELSHVSGRAKLIWGNKKEFTSLNGRNRSFYLMDKLTQEIFS